MKLCPGPRAYGFCVSSNGVAPLFSGELISAGCDSRFIVWDMTQPTVKLVHRVDTTHLGPITSLAISPEGVSFVTGSTDKTVQVWAMIPARKKSTAVQQRAAAAAAAAAAARDPKALAVEDTMGEPELALKLQGHLSDVTCCAFGQTGASLASGSLDHSIMLWNPVAGAHVGILVGHTAAVTDISYSADGRLLLSTSRDHHLRIWHPRSGQTVLVLKQGCGLHSARFSPDASQLVVAGDDGAVRLWSWVGREGSTSMGQMPRKPNLFSRGYTLNDDHGNGNDNGGCSSETAPHSEGSMRTTMAFRKEGSNPLSFEGQAHKGAMTAVAGFSSEFEYETEAVTRQAVAPRRSSHARARGGDASKGGVLETTGPVLSGGEDGFVRKIAAGRGAGKVTMTFKGHSKVGWSCANRVVNHQVDYRSVNTYQPTTVTIVCTCTQLSQSCVPVHNCHNCVYLYGLIERTTKKMLLRHPFGFENRCINTANLFPLASDIHLQRQLACDELSVAELGYLFPTPRPSEPSPRRRTCRQLSARQTTAI